MGNKKITKSKYNLSLAEQKSCHAIIHTASVSAGGVAAGLAQLPLADNAVITPIQVTMIVSLGKVFEQGITKTVAKGLLGGFVASFVGRGVAQAAWGWIPGIGNASNAIIAAAITESIGWLCVDHFYKQRYLVDKGTNTESESATTNNTSKSDSDKEYLSKKILIQKAMEYIDGEKTRRGNHEEFMKLMNEFDDALMDFPEDDKLSQIHLKLSRIK